MSHAVDAHGYPPQRGRMSAIANRIRSVIEARSTSARAVSLAAGLSHNTVWSTLAKLDMTAVIV